MNKLLFFHFDGTCNEPEDGDQAIQGYKQEIEDCSITNVLKLHLMLGGKLTKQNGKTNLGNDSYSFYYQGVGTRGGFFKRLINKGLSPSKGDVKTIINAALNDFKQHYNPDKHQYLVLTGFSRGAALARRFAKVLLDKGYLKDSDKIVVELVFDTVASIGLPNTKQDDRPKSKVVFEDGFTLPSTVKQALHLVSLDDKRDAFQPTLMNHENRVEEVWFSGAHSDVGGGYNFDGLSDITLCYAKDWIEQLDYLAISLKAPSQIEYGSLLPPGKPAPIGLDDLLIDPCPFGVNHQQEQNIASIFLHNDRRCCVIQHDKVVAELAPKVHLSVAQRIAGMREYRPNSLKNVDHYLVFSPWLSNPNLATGVAVHELGFYSNLVMAKTPITTRVVAHRKNNHSGVLVERGHKYRIKVLEGPRWNDSTIKELDGEGWDRAKQHFSFFKNIPIASMEHRKRVVADKAQWFTLCGNIDEDDSKAFVIGNETIYTASDTGELCLFANDLDGFYSNNSGHLLVSVVKQ
ncbi:phospholipase effector Tle1 domain-containing protein [Agarivorans sp. MS3-6]|uniref:phospholipase effector Tle1 domain-containing protein n=1 Tax=Agarivorans sp. TSD2052 TaxID=2937286 RepID=UPI00200DA7A2|nr:DUF2235 domain-containing protein [Agarivorans sp. TSD2052]UPW17292.1 DUF2235 domain-containing protein [Agarivorans sp. TSD2052]